MANTAALSTANCPGPMVTSRPSPGGAVPARGLRVACGRAPHAGAALEVLVERLLVAAAPADHQPGADGDRDQHDG